MLSFAPRGTVFCAATGADTLLDQLAAALATGNDAMLSAEDAALLPPDLPAAVKHRVAIGAADDETVPLALALVDQAYDRRLLVTLSQRHAALVPVVVTRAGEPVSLWRLVAERALCVNTTAAGGNASLMTLEG
jgi:RHH-type proline utilization regulon transcriptional repressor/proline dehydrogenase/delta 1-pyrroline-5-carboxylate dehydrogenase